MIIEDADPATYDELLDLMLVRNPESSASEIGWPFREPENVTHLTTVVARDDAGGPEVLGVAMLAAAVFMPSGWVLQRVVVAPQHERRGVGRALVNAVDGRWPADTVQLRCSVDDQDERALAFAKRFGFEPEVHGITSALELVDLPEPDLPAGLTLDDVSDFVFDDQPAVAELLRASQTNPEAQHGAVLTLDQLAMVPPDSTPVAALASVDGVPAGIVNGYVEGTDFFIIYTGVEPRFRGRGIAKLLKQRAHLLAAGAGAVRTRTTNEAGNTGIRRVNAELGYQVKFGTIRMRRLL